MSRPTALIRRILLLDILEKRLNAERHKVLQIMRENHVRIIQQTPDNVSTSVVYESKGKHDSAIYMNAMLDAEARGVIRLRDIEKELETR